MKKITFLALHLGYGGIEKCISTIANKLCDIYDVEIISTYKLKNAPAFPLNDKIRVTYLLSGDLAKKVESYKINLLHFHWVTLCKELFRDYLKKGKIIELVKDTWASYVNVNECKKKMIDAIKNCDSDVIISSRNIHNDWLGKYGKKESLKIGWEHNYHNNNKRYIKKVVKSVDNLDYFILVSKEQQVFYSKLVKPECIYIPNCIEDYPNTLSKLKDNNIISIGRLSKEKGFSDLIEVCSYVKEVIPNFKLHLVGNGVERSNIEKQIKLFHLEDNVIMQGFKKTEEINELLLNSSIYVMPSFTESFGIVLLEAARYGIPLVSFKNSGACEIISNNWDGYLIDNRDKKIMAKKILELLKNENRRIIMGNNAYKKSLKYNIDNVIEIWKKLLER